MIFTPNLGSRTEITAITVSINFNRSSLIVYHVIGVMDWSMSQKNLEQPLDQHCADLATLQQQLQDLQIKLKKSQLSMN